MMLDGSFCVNGTWHKKQRDRPWAKPLSENGPQAAARLFTLIYPTDETCPGKFFEPKFVDHVHLAFTLLLPQLSTCSHNLRASAALLSLA